MEKFVAAEIASLTAFLIDRTAARTRVDDALALTPAAAHGAAAQRGESTQTLLTTAIDVHLARLIDSPVAKNLRLLLKAFDAVTVERAAGPGAEVITFPRRPRVIAPAPPQRRRAAR